MTSQAPDGFTASTCWTGRARQVWWTTVGRRWWTDTGPQPRLLHRLLASEFQRTQDAQLQESGMTRLAMFIFNESNSSGTRRPTNSGTPPFWGAFARTLQKSLELWNQFEGFFNKAPIALLKNRPIPCSVCSPLLHPASVTDPKECHLRGRGQWPCEVAPLRERRTMKPNDERVVE